jgi:hypothetical protein
MPNLSHAATVSYNEAISGDLNGSQTFTFDVGANTITGTMSYDGFTYDFDSFVFVLPIGLRLTDVSVAFSSVFTMATSPQMLSYLYTAPQLPNTPTLIEQDTIDLLGSSPVSLFVSNLPLSYGAYSISNGFGNIAGVNASWNYTMTFDVSKVPLPPALPLFATGLGLMGLFGWRQRRAGAAA